MEGQAGKLGGMLAGQDLPIWQAQNPTPVLQLLEETILLVPHVW